jgi:hypothetical protein
MLLHSLELAARESQSLQMAVSKGDLETKDLSGKKLFLDFESDKQFVMIDFMGFNFRTEKSSISNDQTVVWENIPIDYRIPYFNSLRGRNSATVPYAFIIPKQWTDIIDILKLHGVEMKPLQSEIEVRADTYEFENARWSAEPFEGRIAVNYDAIPIREKRIFQKGDYLVPLNQRTNRVIMHLLEPKAPDSFVQWGFFNAVFEQKEYGESYKLESLAQSMLQADSSLREAFDQRIKSDSAFAHSSFQRLNWFYKRSPFWDPVVNHYPVGKIMSEKDLH